MPSPLLSIIDFTSILPYYLFLFFPNLVFIRELHLLRLARLFKIGRYSESMRTLGKVILSKREDLFSTLFTVFTLLMISSSFMYFAEHAAQPEKYPNIPSSVWWGIITLTSVGYGDVSPITPIGKILGGIIALREDRAPQVHGWVLELQSGLIKNLDISTEGWHFHPSCPIPQPLIPGFK